MPDLKKYGLISLEWEQILAKQDRKCPLCRKPFTRQRYAVVDHDHLTGAVRGALCSWCNYQLGLLHEDKGWLERAHKYLSCPIADTVLAGPRRHVNAPPEVTR